MQIQTVYFGEVEIDSKKVIYFENGIPGFEEEKEFIILPLEENSAFEVMQSVQNSQLAFIIISPYAVSISYSFDIDEVTVHALGIEEEHEVTVYVIVSLKETLDQSTVNLKAPIIINTTNNKAKQVILNKEEYAIRYPLYVENKKG